MSGKFGGVVLLLLMSSYVSSAQSEHSTSFQHEKYFGYTLGFIQIKDAYNYGLVFNGGQPGFSFSQCWKDVKSLKGLNHEISIAITTSRRMIGASFRIRPLRYFNQKLVWESLSENGNQQKFFIGAYANWEYHYQLYPELQSGHPYWFSYLDIGPSVLYQIENDKHALQLSGFSSVLALCSRTEAGLHEYFYHTSFTDVVTDLHSNLSIGALGKRHMGFQAQWNKKKRERTRLFYRLEMYSYKEDPALNYVNHSIGIKKRLKK